MARPTPKLGKRQKGSAWRHESHALSDAARQQLVGLLGFAGPNEASEPILAEVSRLLGALGSADGRQALDNAPRGSDYVRGYRKLAKSVRALQAELASLHPRLTEQLDACLMSTPAGTIEQARGTVDCLLHAVTDGQALWHKSSAGRPKSIAVPLLVLQLRTLFRKHYRGPAARAKKRAAFASLRVGKARAQVHRDRPGGCSNPG